MEGDRCSPQRILLGILIDLSVFIDSYSPGFAEDCASLSGNLLDGICSIGQILGNTNAVFTGGDGIHHSTVLIGNRELSTDFCSIEIVDCVHDLLGNLNFTGNNGIGTTCSIRISEAVVFLIRSYGEGLLPLRVKQVACGCRNFLDFVSANGENIVGLCKSLGIRGQLTDHITGSINLVSNLYRIGTAVNHLELGSCQGCFALCSLSGYSIILFNADRTEQIDVDGFVNAPVAICHLRQNRLGFVRPHMLSAAGLGSIFRNRTVQRTLNHRVAKRVLHFRDLHCSKG